MKNLKEHINEAIKKGRLGIVNITVGQLVGRYYSTLNIKNMKLNDFEITDFDPVSLEKHFSGDYKKQFDFLVKHADNEIVVRQDFDTSADSAPYILNFNVDGIDFEVVSTIYFDKYLQVRKY